MEIHIGSHIIGRGYPTFIVAEMSGNHGGNLNNAIELIHAAKRAGANAIKLQTYTADTITLNSEKEDFLIPDQSAWRDHKTLYNLYRVAHTPWSWHEEIFKEARKLNLEVFSSAFDETSVDFLESLQIPAYKIASPEINHIPLLKKVANTRKPIIISTGISDLEDIELALSVLKEHGATQIGILKCTSSYPAPPEDSNLKTIADIGERFNVVTGLSDHTVGNACAIASVALGASIIEKHLMLEDGKSTVDSFFSSSEREFSKLVKDVRIVERSIGQVTYDIPPSAAASYSGRRSLYVSSNIKAGEKFTDKNIKSVRPSFGLHPKYYDEIIGRRAKVDLFMGERMTWEVIE